MIVDKVRREIARYDKPENRLNYQRFFKEKLDDPYGLKTAILRKISNQCFREIKDRPKQEIFGYCDQFVKSGEKYHRFFAFEWATKLKDQYAKTDFTRFESWLKKYVNNWGSCDHICGGPIGHLVAQFPETVQKTKKWTSSKNRWLRRASAVSLIVAVRKRLLLDDVFGTADTLLTDGDDMVQKGYGWMLKEASNEFPKEVFEYVMKNKKEMPRTALRYAIEKLPANKRKEAMKKDW
jgi:3-methyladenine DNA glycosylase AlkD